MHHARAIPRATPKSTAHISANFTLFPSLPPPSHSFSTGSSPFPLYACIAIPSRIRVPSLFPLRILSFFTFTTFLSLPPHPVFFFFFGSPQHNTTPSFCTFKNTQIKCIPQLSPADPMRLRPSSSQDLQLHSPPLGLLAAPDNVLP